MKGFLALRLLSRIAGITPKGTRRIKGRGMVDMNMQQLTQIDAGPPRTNPPSASRLTTIAFIESGTADGGSVAWLLSTLTYLDRTRFEPLVIFYYAARGTMMEKIRALGVPIYLASAKSPSYLPRWLRSDARSRFLQKCISLGRIAYRLSTRDTPITIAVRRHLRKNRVDVVVLNSDLHFQYCGAVAARLENLPVVCRKTGGINEGLRIKKLLTPLVDVFVPGSKATEKDQLKNPATKRSVLLYEGIDISKYPGRRHNPRLRSALGLPENKKIVTSVARLEVGKGQPELIEAAARVIQEFPEVVFLLVGEETPPNGPNTSVMRNNVLRLGLTNHIVFAGARGDVPDILAVTDVFVHCPTTWIEGLGICHLEAMASGIPSVISRNGGLPEPAIEGVTGFVVAPADIAAMSRAILHFLMNPEAAEKFGRAARARAEELFDVARNNVVLENLLDELASRRTGDR
jgi:glycosyltransferase involved in cell wall biosynthesis